MILLDDVSVQDRDLLGRLVQYFGSLDARIKEGQGWLIFGADRGRAARITRFALERLAERRPFVSYYHVPWRDFALNAYMLKVELRDTPAAEPAHGPPAAGAVAPGSGLVLPPLANTPPLGQAALGPEPGPTLDRAAVERDIAGRVTRDQFYQMRFADVLLLVGLAPAHQHEIEHLDVVMAERFARRLPTILLTPRAPHELMADYARQGAAAAWARLYEGMYASSLIAL